MDLPNSGPTGRNPLQYNPEDDLRKMGTDAPKTRGPDKAPRKRRRKKISKAVKMFTAEQWAELVKRVVEARNKGWSLTRCARNLNLSTYRVRQALGYSHDTGGATVHPRLITPAMGAAPAVPGPNTHLQPESGGVAETPTTQKAAKDDQEQAILDLLTVIPTMRNASAKFWLRHLSDLL